MSNILKTICTRIQNKHAYEYDWRQATDFIPLAGELIIYDPDTDAPQPMTGSNSLPRIKIGDGKTPVNSLSFVSSLSEDIGGSGLPEVTTGDNGKTVKVVDGEWSVEQMSYNDLSDKPELFSGNYNDLSDKPTQLPSVTSSDNGAFLRVVDGAWAATTVPNAEETSF